jgi:hypothetical protein
MSGSSRSWRKWHRWGGLLVALPLLVLAVTGLLLNHAGTLDLAQKRLPMSLARAYGVQPPDEVLASHAMEPPLLFAGSRLYRRGAPVAPCDSPFHGAVALERVVVAGCGGEILVLSPAGEVMERAGSAWGLPGFTALGRHDGRVVLVSPEGPVLLNTGTLETRPLPPEAEWQRAHPAAAEGHAAREIRHRSVPAEMNWERLLLDLHSGRLGGGAGVLVMDLAAVLLLALATTGIVIWWRGRRRRL